MFQPSIICWRTARISVSSAAFEVRIRDNWEFVTGSFHSDPAVHDAVSSVLKVESAQRLWLDGQQPESRRKESM